MTSGYGDGADRFAQQLIGDLPEVSRSVVAYKLGALMLSGFRSCLRREPQLSSGFSEFAFAPSDLSYTSVPCRSISAHRDRYGLQRVG